MKEHVIVIFADDDEGKKVDLFGMMFVINGNFKWMRNKQKTLFIG